MWMSCLASGPQPFSGDLLFDQVAASFLCFPHPPIGDSFHRVLSSLSCLMQAESFASAEHRVQFRLTARYFFTKFPLPAYPWSFSVVSFLSAFTPADEEHILTTGFRFSSSSCPCKGMIFSDVDVLIWLNRQSSACSFFQHSA